MHKRIKIKINSANNEIVTKRKKETKNESKHRNLSKSAEIPNCNNCRHSFGKDLT